MKAAPAKRYMQLAIDVAGKNLKSMEGGPFGACIVKSGRVIATARNTVLKNSATHHAEINAIRMASRRLKNYDLSGSIIYSTTEPCPMCFAAIHWARIEEVVYGTSIADAERIGFNELRISNQSMKSMGKSKVLIHPGFMRQECLKLFQEFDSMDNKRLY